MYIHTVFSLISAGPKISATHLGILTEISASPVTGAAPLNMALIIIATILY